MKVLTINVELGGRYLHRRNKSFGFVDRYVRLINKYKIDVICFQEAVLREMKLDVTMMIAEKLGYYHRANRKAELATIAKYPLEKLSDDKYNFLCCKCSNRYIVNIHLHDQPNTYFSLIGKPYGGTPKNLTEKQAIQLSYEGKSEDLKQTFKLIGKNPAVICGDFNELSHLDSLPWKVSKKIYSKGFVDLVRTFKPDCDKYPMYTCDVQRKESRGNPPVRIDMIYCRDVRPRAVKYLTGLKLNGQYLSDHVPILGNFD